MDEDGPIDNARYAGGAAYVQGAFVPIAEAKISVLDWGFTRSDAVYDVVHVFQGGFFRLDDHLDRFAASMAARRLRLSESRERLEDVLHRCVALAGLHDAYVAMVASRGRPRIAGSRRPGDCDNHLIAYAIPWVDVFSKAVQERGAHIWIAAAPRAPDASFDPTVKNYQWGEFTSGLLEAEDHGCDSTIVCDAAGFVTEGPGFNVFIVKDGRVATPDRGSLHGITRKTVLELCAAMGIQAQVAPISRAALEGADEVFLASTAGGIMPASRVAGRIFGNDRPGPVSRALQDLYWRRHAEGWYLTPVRSLAVAAKAGPSRAG